VVTKKLGDGIFCHFADADGAFRTACAMQEEALEPEVRIGFAFGPVVIKGADVLGDTVNVCGRLVAIANPRQALTTEQTVEALSPGLRPRCRKLYPVKMKGRVGEVTVCEVMVHSAADLTVTTKLDPQDATPRRWALKLTYAGATFTVEPGGSVRLGRDKTNDVVIESSLASRQHARIYERDGHFMLVDQSSNGTFMRNDGHINEIALRREEAALGERGWIGLGRPAQTHGEHVLRYRLERRGG
jgi:hypothetical protein